MTDTVKTLYPLNKHRLSVCVCFGGGVGRGGGGVGGV